jgi:hypothetical protein
VQVLVAVEEVREGARGEEDLRRVQRAALVQVAQAPVEERLLLRQLHLRGGQLRGGGVDLLLRLAELHVQLAHQAGRDGGLAADDVELRVDVVHLLLDALQLAAQLLALAADLLQAALALGDLLLRSALLREGGEREEGGQQERRGAGGAHRQTASRWRRTATMLLRKPNTVPATTTPTIHSEGSHLRAKR